MTHYLKYGATLGIVATSLLVSGCGSDEAGVAPLGGSGGTGAGGTGAGGSGAGGKGPTCVASADAESNCSDGADDDCDGFTDCLDPECESKSCGTGAGLLCLAGACLGAGPLPKLPNIENLVPTVRGDTAIIDFSPVLGALDYRIYTLPAEADVLVGQSGEVAVKNAIYRCGGALPRFDRSNDGLNRIGSSLSGNVEGYSRQESDAVLGYVFLTPGPGRVPIYRVANPNSIGGYTWETDNPPSKEFNGADYVQTTQERDALLAQGWRDDGVAFYVSPDGTRSVYRREYTDSGFVIFYTDGAEKDAHASQSNSTEGERFKILDATADGAVPLYRIYYSYHHDHDVLAAGDANKARVLNQGNIPITSLMWPGLTGSTTLVIEALDKGCPFPGGFIGPTAAPGADLGGVMSLPTITLEDARLSSGEVFINGQFESTNRPKPIARAYVTVDAKAHPTMDWFESFDGDTGAFETVVNDNIGTRVYRNGKISVEFQQSNENYTYGNLLGQFASGSVSNWGVVALGANARLEASTYLHATMMSDLASTRRRYPQIFITDAPLGDPAKDDSPMVPFGHRLGPWPIDMAPPGPYHTIVAQTFSGNAELQIEFCDQRGWGVSQQCPKANIYGFPSGETNSVSKNKWLPLPVTGEYAGMDRLVKFDVYASASRVYLFIEDRPAGCAVLPAGKMPAGPVNVIFSQAAYHIEIDEFVVRDPASALYWQRYSVAHSDRKMDDLGVESGVSLPSWDESVMPCGDQYYGGPI